VVAEIGVIRFVGGDPHGGSVVLPQKDDPTHRLNGMVPCRPPCHCERSEAISGEGVEHYAAESTD